MLRNGGWPSILFKNESEPKNLLGKCTGIPTKLGRLAVVLRSSRKRAEPSPSFHITLRHGEAVFGLSRLHEDANGVGPPAPGMSARSAQ
jgi:hypothetical protein